jgi:cation diffusion facilitator family transporter
MEHGLGSHGHVFDTGNPAGERRSLVVVAITAAMMVFEVAVGWWANSMALLADGWHMGSHAVAIGLCSLAYAAARRWSRDRRFAFGTWKTEVLAGFAGAILLFGIALTMVVESVERLLTPGSIRFVEALVVAGLGLVVNIVCAVILGGGQHHDHGGGGHAHHDLNLKSAYLHVLTDAATSVLAILALLGGLVLGWGRLDPVMGIVGAFLVGAWAVGLLRETAAVLLDREMDHPVVEEIRDVMAAHPAWKETTRVQDLHVWRVGRRQYAVIISLLTDDATVTPEAVRRALSVHEELTHVTVEVNRLDHG